MKLKFDFVNAHRNFNGAVERMSQMTGIDRKAIIMAEAGSVLKKCVAMTKKPPSQAVLTTSGRLRAVKYLNLTQANPISVTAGIRGSKYGRVWFRKSGSSNVRQSHDANFSPLNRHFKDWQWEAINQAISEAKAEVAEIVPQAKASAGLARGSWVLIADSLGIRLEAVPGGGVSASAISSAREARAKHNKQAQNGTSRVESRGLLFAATLINRLPYGGKLGFQGKLDAAIAGRAAFMARALLKGFTGSAADIAKLFPGWTIKTGGN